MTIRKMTPSDIRFALDLTNAEGWVGETRDVFEAFLAYDPAGCFIAEHDAREVGVCVATRYRTSGFIGELIVVKDMRGLGYGRKLFECSIRYLKSHGIENIYLDGDLDAVPFYETIGFRKICRSLRFVGRLAGRRNGLIRNAGPEDTDVVCGIDRDLYGDDRGFFLRRRLELFSRLNLVLEIDGRLCGYIMAHPGNGVLSVGPWAVFDCQEKAKLLLEAAASEAGGQPLRIGVLESSTAAVDLIESIGSFEEQTPCWRMGLGPSSAIGGDDRLYAIGSAAKG
ncbi:MAG: GNAT family N-acetyltransferase [Candidatus Latescibacterota bacterium]|nr:MAG: GNAT family N-acetyltransferase [Candidatus Latescibacterota bacterium]